MSEFSINNIKEIQQLIILDEVNKTEVRNCSGGFFNRVSNVLTVYAGCFH